MNRTLIEKVTSGHKHRFGGSPQAVAYAPGRIEVLGNHTDYNEGYVLSAAIDAGICAAVSDGEGKHCVLSALDVAEEAAFDLPVEKPIKSPHWANYLIGVANKLGGEGKIEKGFNLTFAGDVPPGAGLSSSAALEVATALALSSLFNLNLKKAGRALDAAPSLAGLSGASQAKALHSKLDLMHIARLCQQAENEFTGARCGLLDQISSLFGKEHSLIFTDFRSLKVDTEKIGADVCFLLANTGVKHNLVESAYNDRRVSCELAAKYFASVLDHPVKHPAASRGATCSAEVALATQVESLLASAEPPAKPGRNPATCPPKLSERRRKPRAVAASYAVVALATEAESHRAFWRRRVKALRDVSQEELKKYSAGLDPVIFKRAAHIVGENERVLEARRLLKSGDMKKFGELMFASHQSSRVSFENSCEELDFIVDTASGLKEVLGARLSGGGFGGSAVLLVNPQDAAEIGGKISSAYAKRFGRPCQVRIIKPSAGARVVKLPKGRAGASLRRRSYLKTS